MPTTVAALRGKLGTTEYFILSMKANELVSTVKIPSEIEGWENLSIEERYQRDISFSRVKKQIAPYLARDPHRFFGAIIVAAENLKPSQFKPLSKITAKDLPDAYDPGPMGFLTFKGGERMFPLDGQHRLKAIDFALRGTDEGGKKIVSIPKPARDLANEDVTVIVVPFDPQNPQIARKIFTKVNRYAKKTSTGQNLVTDDDDIIAVLSREVSNVIGGRLVKYEGSTLSNKDWHFTTLSNLALCNVEILDSHTPPETVERIDRSQLPSEDSIDLCRETIQREWGILLHKVELFSDMLTDKTEKGDDKRREIRENYLLGKPIPQKCLVCAYLALTQPEDDVAPMSPDQAVKNLNMIPWRQDHERWDGLLMQGTKLLDKHAPLAAKIIAYWAGAQLSTSELQELEEKYVKLFPKEIQEKKKLPEPVV